MHRQVTVVAILMIVQGALQIIMGGIFAAVGPLMMGLMQSAPTTPSSQDEAVMTGVSIYYMLAGLLTLGVGIFQIIAGIRGLKFRGRTMGIVAIASNLLSFATCYCIPTGIGVMVYGLIVYLNAQTARAFALGAQGNMTADEIKATVDNEMRGGYAAAPQYPQQGQYPGQGQPPPPPPGYGSPPPGGPGAPPGF